jgi:hypothetical protein
MGCRGSLHSVGVWFVSSQTDRLSNHRTTERWQMSRHGFHFDLASPAIQRRAPGLVSDSTKQRRCHLAVTARIRLISEFFPERPVQMFRSRNAARNGFRSTPVCQQTNSNQILPAKGNGFENKPPCHTLWPMHESGEMTVALTGAQIRWRPTTDSAKRNRL